MRRRRLIWRLFPSYLVVVLAAMLAITAYGSRSILHFHRQQADAALRSQAELLALYFEPLLDGQQHREIDRICAELGARLTTRITVIAPEGRVLGDSADTPGPLTNKALYPEVRAALEGSIGVESRFSPAHQDHVTVLARPLMQDGAVIGVLRLERPAGQVDAALWSLYAQIGVGGMVIAVLAAAVSWAVARRIARPLEAMKQGAERFARGAFAQPLPTPQTYELASLADALNLMAAQLRDRIATVMQQRNEKDAVLAGMVESVIAVGPGERIFTLNGAAARLLGVRPDKAMGQSLRVVARNPALQRFVTETLRSGGPLETEIVFHRPGDQQVVQVHGTTLRDAQGRGIGAVFVGHDLTSQRRLDRIRRDFVANVSHELKTPLTTVKGFVETLLDGAIDCPEDAREFLEIIARHTDRMARIIDDLLVLARVEQDEIRHGVPLTPGPIRRVIEAAAQACSAQAALKDIQLVLDCSDELTGRCDPELLEQAVVNLIDNAIKYSAPGSRVWAGCSQSAARIHISVRDEGCGIPPAHLDRVFERFYRVDRARSRQLGGTGLGLAIVKHIAQVHMGEVSVTSEPGRGSEFVITLPALHSDQAEPADTNTAAAPLAPE